MHHKIHENILSQRPPFSSFFHFFAVDAKGLQSVTWTEQIPQNIGTLTNLLQWLVMLKRPLKRHKLRVKSSVNSSVDRSTSKASDECIKLLDAIWLTKLFSWSGSFDLRMDIMALWYSKKVSCSQDFQAAGLARKDLVSMWRKVYYGLPKCLGALVASHHIPSVPSRIWVQAVQLFAPGPSSWLPAGRGLSGTDVAHMLRF